MARFTVPDNFSNATPLSFCDDGVDLNDRMPHGDRPNIEKWIEDTKKHSKRTKAPSTYTGSFIDDGADMVAPSKHTPGFGKIDPNFYKNEKQQSKTTKNGRVWTDDMQKAVSGDIQNTYAKIKRLSQIQVRKAEKPKQKGTVTVWVPPTFGRFVVKHDDGRVWMLDDDGEYDSGPQKLPPGEDPVRWVKAVSTSGNVSQSGDTDYTKSPSTVEPSYNSADVWANGESEVGMKKRLANSEDSVNTRKRDSLFVRPLPPIKEDNQEDRPVREAACDTKAIMSPTDFFMSGGGTGWSSPAAFNASPGPSSPARGWPSPAEGSAVSMDHSLPGIWPSPTSSTESVLGTDDPWEANDSWLERLQRPRRDVEAMSIRTYSTYRPPTVDDAPDSSVKDKTSPRPGWGGSAKASSVRSGGRNSWRDSQGVDRQVDW